MTARLFSDKHGPSDSSTQTPGQSTSSTGGGAERLMSPENASFSSEVPPRRNSTGSIPEPHGAPSAAASRGAPSSTSSTSSKPSGTAFSAASGSSNTGANSRVQERKNHNDAHQEHDNHGYQPLKESAPGSEFHNPLQAPIEFDTASGDAASILYTSILAKGLTAGQKYVTPAQQAELKKVSAELGDFAVSAFGTELGTVFKAPISNPSAMKVASEEIFQILKSSETTQKFVGALIDINLVGELPKLVDEFNQLIEGKAQDTVEVQIKLASDKTDYPDEDTLRHLLSLDPDAPLKITTQVVPSLIGGCIISTETARADFSYASRLNPMETQAKAFIAAEKAKGDSQWKSIFPPASARTQTTQQLANELGWGQTDKPQAAAAH